MNDQQERSPRARELADKRDQAWERAGQKAAMARGVAKKLPDVATPSGNHLLDEDYAERLADKYVSLVKQANDAHAEARTYGERLTQLEDPNYDSDE